VFWHNVHVKVILSDLWFWLFVNYFFKKIKQQQQQQQKKKKKKKKREEKNVNKWSQYF
jgi:uncharacterized membrane protein